MTAFWKLQAVEPSSHASLLAPPLFPHSASDPATHFYYSPPSFSLCRRRHLFQPRRREQSPRHQALLDPRDGHQPFVRPEDSRQRRDRILVFDEEDEVVARRGLGVGQRGGEMDHAGGSAREEGIDLVVVPLRRFFLLLRQSKRTLVSFLSCLR